MEGLSLKLKFIEAVKDENDPTFVGEWGHPFSRIGRDVEIQQLLGISSDSERWVHIAELNVDGNGGMVTTGTVQKMFGEPIGNTACVLGLAFAGDRKTARDMVSKQLID